MSDLNLNVKKKWFDMTDSRVKPEEYREINEYWFKRLVFQYKKVFRYTCGFDFDMPDKQVVNAALQKMVTDASKVKMIGFKPFDHNVVMLGYPKSGDSNRIRKYKHIGIEIRTGNPEWGAEPNKLYFVIKHGELIKWKA